MVENVKPNFKGTLQIKNAEGKFVSVGAIKLYIRVPKNGETPEQAAKLPSLKGYIGINDTEFYEVSLWENA